MNILRAILFLFAPVLTIGPVAAAQSLAELGWSVFTLDDKKPTHFALQGRSIEVLSDNSVAFLYRRLTPDEAKAGCASWQWLVQQTMAPTDLSKQGADDRPLAVHLVFPFPDESVGLWTWARRKIVARKTGDVFKGRSLTYVWGGTRPAGSWMPNPFAPKDAALLTLQPGSAALNQWRQESIRFRDDYERIFKAHAPDPVLVVISGDSDDTHTQANGYIANLDFKTDADCGRTKP